MQILSDQLKREVKGKVSQFILSEAGRVGYRNAFSMAALVTASSLAAVMLSVHPARADLVNCGDDVWCDNYVWNFCCEVNTPDGDWVYMCSNSPDPVPGQPHFCWPI